MRLTAETSRSEARGRPAGGYTAKAASGDCPTSDDLIAFVEHEINELPRDGGIFQRRRELLTAILARLT